MAQSLAEAARKEAERRKNLDQNGIEAKVIEEDDLPQAALLANVSISSPVLPSKPPSKESASKAKVQPYRSALQRYDREIKQREEKLNSLRARLNAEKWALPKLGKMTRSSGSSSSQEKLKVQIQDLELKLVQLRRERLETYDAGRKAGFLPGELDGKGVMP
jgi:hypothetical protein